MNISEFITKILIPEIYTPILSILLAIIIIKISKKIIINLIKIKLGNVNLSDNREKTLSSLIVSVIKVIVWLIAILTTLSVYGINTASIVTSLGVIGFAIGLGAQDVIKDIFSGFMIILDKKYNIGDIIEVNGFKGEVVHLGIQTTKIKKWTGEIMIVFNRNINEVINYSVSNSIAIVDVAVSPEEDITKVEKTLNDLLNDLNEKLENLKGSIELKGIEEVSDMSINFRITVETPPEKQYEVQRTIRREVKLALDKAKIGVPYRQREVHKK